MRHRTQAITLLCAAILELPLVSMADTEALPNSWTPRRTVVATLVVSAVCLVFFLAYLLQSVVFLLFVGVVIATALKPLIAMLERAGLTHGSSVAVVYAVLSVTTLLLAVAGLPLLVDQLSTIVGEVPKYYESFRGELLKIRGDFIHRLAVQLPESIFIEPKPGDTEAAPPPNGLNELTQALSFGEPVLQGVLGVLAAMLFAFYWSLQEDRSIRALLLLVPTAKRDDARELFDTMQAKVGAYLRGQGILCLVVGSMNFVAFLLIGLPNALALGVVAGICEAVPMFGPVLGAIPAAAVAFSVDPSKVIWVGVAALLIQQAENYLLVPRVMDHSVGVNPVVTLLAIAGFGSLLGFAGAILAIPLAAIIQVILQRFVFSSQALEPPPPTGRDAKSLVRYQARELVHDVRLQSRRPKTHSPEITDKIEEELESIARDLDRELAPAPGAELDANGGDSEEQLP